MGLKGLNKEQEGLEPSNALEEALNSQKQNSEPNLGGDDNYIGLVDSSLYRIETNSGLTSDLSVFADKLQEVLDKIDHQYVYNVFKLNGGEDYDIKYATIVVAGLDKTRKRVNYFTFVMEASGKDPMTPTTIMDEINIARNTNVDALDRIYVPADAIDDTMFEAIEQMLHDYYSSRVQDVRFINVDGTIVGRETDISSDATVAKLAKDAAYFIYTEHKLASGVVRDLNLNKVVSDMPSGSELNILAYSGDKTVRDVYGNAFREDWSTVLNAKTFKTRRRIKSVNDKHTALTEFVRVSGYTDLIPMAVSEANKFTGQMENKTKLMPNVVITNTTAMYPTLNHTLLSILTASVAIRKDIWVPSLMAKIGLKVGRKNTANIGFMNIVTDIYSSRQKDEAPGIIDLTDPAYDNRSVQEIIETMCTESGLLSIDIDTYGPNMSRESAILTAAIDPATVPSKDVLDNRKNAAEKIITSLHVLTNGLFPKSYNLEKLFYGHRIETPKGTFVSKDGELKDLRDIDIVQITSSLLKQDEMKRAEIVNRWAKSGLPGQPNSYYERISILNELKINANITGKTFRVVLHPEFISELSRCISKAGITLGINTGYTSLIRNDFGDNIAYAGAAINPSSVGFAVQTQRSGDQSVYHNGLVTGHQRYY